MFDEQSTSSASDAQPEKPVLSEVPSPPASPQPSLSDAENTDTFALPGNFPSKYQAVPPSRPAPLAVGKGRFLWGRDPVYRVLFVGIVLAIIVSIIVIGQLSSAFSQLPSLFGGNSAGTTQTGSTTQGTVDARPSFPTPGGHGSTQSSQPPKSGVPTILPTSPTPTVAITPTGTVGQGGTLTVQIVSVPAVVNNNTTVTVAVNANQAGATVQLIVIYNAPPGLYTSVQETTDSNGNASLIWNIHVLSRGSSVIARLDVTAHSQDGQQAVSGSITVQVIGAGTGG